MNFDLSIPSQLSAALGPELLLIAGAMVLMLWAAWRPDSAEHQRRVGLASLVLVAAVAATVVWYMSSHVTVTVGVIAADPFRWVTDIVILFATGCTIALSVDYNRRERITPAEAHVLVLFAASGMMVLAAARDLMIVFLGIELMSVSVYVLSGLNRRSARAAEGALKYFLLGAFSTAFLLYGIALTYGATGATNFYAIGERVARYDLVHSPLMLVGLALLLIGFGFKVAAAPFHMWAPDVYEGAPTPMTAFMAAAVKAAAFAAFLRLWFEAFGDVGLYQKWHTAVWWLAAVTMVVGNVIALAQRNIKRMLAYSSIAHAGYLLVTFAAGVGAGRLFWNGASALLFYLLAYTLATMGAFALISALTEDAETHLSIEDLSGLWVVRPILALAMGVCMLSLLGFPLFGGMGFFAKWYILQTALYGGAEPQTRLAVILVLTSVQAAAYYLYVLMVMFMRPRPDDATPVRPVGRLTGAVIAVSVSLLLVFGVWPSGVLRQIRAAGPAAPNSAERAAEQPVASRPAAAVPWTARPAGAAVVR